MISVYCNFSCLAISISCKENGSAAVITLSPPSNAVDTISKRLRIASIAKAMVVTHMTAHSTAVTRMRISLLR